MVFRAKGLSVYTKDRAIPVEEITVSEVKKYNRVLVLFGHSEWDKFRKAPPTTELAFLFMKPPFGGRVVSYSTKACLSTNQYAVVMEHPKLPATEEGKFIPSWSLEDWRKWVAGQSEPTTDGFIPMRCVDNGTQGGNGALTVGKVYMVKVNPGNPQSCEVQNTDNHQFEGGYFWLTRRFEKVEKKMDSEKADVPVGGEDRPGPGFVRMVCMDNSDHGMSGAGYFTVGKIYWVCPAGHNTYHVWETDCGDKQVKVSSSPHVWETDCADKQVKVNSPQFFGWFANRFSPVNLENPCREIECRRLDKTTEPVPSEPAMTGGPTEAVKEVFGRFFDEAAVGKRWVQVVLPRDRTPSANDLGADDLGVLYIRDFVDGDDRIVTLECSPRTKVYPVGGDGMVERVNYAEWLDFLNSLRDRLHQKVGVATQPVAAAEESWTKMTARVTAYGLVQGLTYRVRRMGNPQYVFVHQEDMLGVDNRVFEVGTYFVAADEKTGADWFKAVCKQGGNGLTEGKSYLVRLLSNGGFRVHTDDLGCLADYGEQRFTPKLPRCYRCGKTIRSDEPVWRTVQLAGAPSPSVFCGSCAPVGASTSMDD